MSLVGAAGCYFPADARRRAMRPSVRRPRPVVRCRPVAEQTYGIARQDASRGEGEGATPARPEAAVARRAGMGPARLGGAAHLIACSSSAWAARSRSAATAVLPSTKRVTFRSPCSRRRVVLARRQPRSRLTFREHLHRDAASSVARPPARFVRSSEYAHPAHDLALTCPDAAGFTRTLSHTRLTRAYAASDAISRCDSASMPVPIGSAPVPPRDPSLRTPPATRVVTTRSRCHELVTWT